MRSDNWTMWLGYAIAHRYEYRKRTDKITAVLIRVEYAFEVTFSAKYQFLIRV